MEKNELDIIKKVSQILSLTQGIFDVAEILSKINQESPDQIYHQLAEYEENILLKEIETDEADKDDESIYWWVQIQDFSCIVRALKSFRKIDLWDSINARNIFIIRVNETRDGSFQIAHANTDVRFYSEDERDKEYLRVQRRLAVFSFIKFL